MTGEWPEGGSTDDDDPVEVAEGRGQSRGSEGASVGAVDPEENLIGSGGLGAGRPAEGADPPPWNRARNAAAASVVGVVVQREPWQ